MSLRTTTPLQDLELLTRWAREHDVELADLAVARPTLEDIYLTLTS